MLEGSMTGKKKALIISLSIVMVLAAAGGVAWYVMSQRSSSTSPDTSQDAKAKERYDLYVKASGVTKADPAGAQAILDDALKQQTTPEDKAAIYGLKASVAASYENGYNYKDALTFALQAEDLSPSVDTAVTLGFYYRQLGDKPKAAQFYQKAIDRMGNYDDLDAMKKSDYDYYKWQVQDLSR